MSTLSTRIRLRLLAIGLLVLAGGVLALTWLVRQPPPRLASARSSFSSSVTARDGRLLRATLTASGAWRLPTRYVDVPQHYIELLVAYEDRRFFQHNGVDLRAIARAAFDLLRHGHALSGASTLTMQTARLIDPEGLRGHTVWTKIVQAVRALQLEHVLSKSEILDLYLSHAPLGGNVEGVRAASLGYFGIEPEQLDIGQAATLVALAQAPSRRRPDRFPERAAGARDRVIETALAQNLVPPSVRQVLGTRVQAAHPRPPMLAAHFTDRMLKHRGGEIATSIDYGLQSHVEQLARDALSGWAPEMNAAIVVVDNRTCSYRGYVGAARYASSINAGQFDHVRGVRSPGSTLKPIIYGMGFEELLLHPQSIVSDRAIRINGYAPRNFSDGFQGEMTAREALIKSINTTAVAVLSRVGPARLATRLRGAGLPLALDATDSDAGLAIGLGGAGTSLETLVRLYTGLATDGRACPSLIGVRTPSLERPRVLKADAAWAVRDILADSPPPPGFSVRHSADGSRRIAYKTGTSFGYRDAWAIGFDRDYTVGVWLGRTDGAATFGATGIGSAAPILYRTFDFLPVPEGDVAGPAPADSVLAKRTGLPERLLRFGAARDASNGRDLHILFPTDNATIALIEQTGQTSLTLSAIGGSPPYYWSVDGEVVGGDGSSVRYAPRGLGQFVASVMDATGISRSVRFWIRKE